MKTIANIIWFLFAGIWLWLGYILAGIMSFLFIITIPCGIASFRMARYVAWPFGRTVVDAPRAGAHTTAANIVWLVIAGWWLALAHIATALAQAITIIGLMNAWVSIKMIPISLAPFGKKIVDSSSVRGATFSL